MFAYHLNFTKDEYKKRVDTEVELGRLAEEMYESRLDGALRSG